MASDFNEDMVRNFVNSVFETSNNIGSLTVRSVRERFLEHSRLKKLEPEQKAILKKTVYEVYLHYTKGQDKENGSQDSSTSVAESQSSSQSEGEEGSSPSALPINEHDQSEHGTSNKKTSTKVASTFSCEQFEEEDLVNNNHDLKNEERNIPSPKLTFKGISGELDSPISLSDEDDLSKEEMEETHEKDAESRLDSGLSKLGSTKEMTGRKKKMKPKETTLHKKKKRSPPSSGESTKLKSLKRYVRNCGLHMNYVKLFAECKGMSQKERILDRDLRMKTGFEGRITLKMCKKFKQAKEEADEIAALDTKNIISEGDGRRPKRSCVGLDEPPKHSAPNSDMASLFSRLKGVVDSDDSGSENGRGKAQPVSDSSDDDSVQHNKKRRKLESSSDDDLSN